MANNKRKTNLTKLDAINKLIDWAPIERQLHKFLKRRKNAAGKPPYPALVMFKVLVVQNLYGLSDAETEEQLRDRISFLRFAGLSINDDTPDSSTICRFRSKLLGERKTEILHKMVLSQLQPYGELKHGVSGGNGNNDVFRRYGCGVDRKGRSGALWV